MQLTVSTMLGAEQRHELSQSQTWGRGLGVAQAVHLHLPHTTQMMESEAGDWPGLVMEDTRSSFSLWSGTVFGDDGGWAVITDIELGGSSETVE